jgi:hypothetical protein
MMARCSQIEAVGRAGSADGAARMLDDLQAEFQEVRVALEAELERGS